MSLHVLIGNYWSTWSALVTTRPHETRFGCPMFRLFRLRVYRAQWYWLRAQDGSRIYMTIAWRDRHLVPLLVRLDGGAA